MTNYNERLDEILAYLGERHIMVEHRLIHLGMPEQNGKNIETREAKQAITSLIKELVAEAKPGVPEEYERDDALYIGFERGTEHYYDAISNLLKALEEE